MDLSNLRTKILQEFTKKNKGLLDEWSEKSMQTFLEHCHKYTEDMYTGNLTIVDGVSNDHHEQIQTLENLFKNLTQTRGEIKHQLRIKYSIARKQFMDNLGQNTFRNWRTYVKHKKYLRQMNVYCNNYSKYRIPRIIFDSWRKNARKHTRNEILNQVNRKTDSEVMSMQKEYEAIIAQLENVLEKRLLELKVEEEQHKELVNRYEGIVEKRAAVKH